MHSSFSNPTKDKAIHDDQAHSLCTLLSAGSLSCSWLGRNGHYNYNYNTHANNNYHNLSIINNRGGMFSSELPYIR